MRNINRNILITTVVAAVVLVAFAVDIVPSSESLSQKMEKKELVQAVNFLENDALSMKIDNYVKISISELPQTVKSAVISKYVAYSIEQVFQAGNTVFRLVLKDKQKKLVVYYTADGEYLSQEVLENIQLVKL